MWRKPGVMVPPVIPAHRKLRQEDFGSQVPGQPGPYLTKTIKKQRTTKSKQHGGECLWSLVTEESNCKRKIRVYLYGREREYVYVGKKELGTNYGGS
jgi:hypothetical protein